MYQSFRESTNQELTNDIVTISKLQVGLRIKTKLLQERLVDLLEKTSQKLSQQPGEDKMEMFFELLQEMVDLLLGNASFWSHVLASSQTFGGWDVAEDWFQQLSFQERNKLTRDVPIDALDPTNLAENTATYVVVTLLLGTADDQPLFSEIYSASLLKDVLQNMTMMRSQYLKGFDLIWNPPMPQDKLSQAELDANYAELVEIA